MFKGTDESISHTEFPRNKSIISLVMNIQDTKLIIEPRRVTEGGGLPCPFSKIGKKYSNLEKKCPDCGHLWVKFFI